MSCVPTPRSKSPGQLEGSRCPYVCDFFSCFSVKILIVFFQVSLYFISLCRCKLQAKGQGPRIRGCWADARMGPFRRGVGISRLHRELRWSAGSNYFLPFLSTIVTECSHQINTCESEHDAIVRAQTQCTPGYAVTGVGVVICSRHVLVRRNAAGDPQKGEKYIRRI